MGDDRASAYWEDRKPILRASAFGQPCTAALARQLAGQPAQPWPKVFLEKFDEGNKAEPKILRIMEGRYGWKRLGADELRTYGPIHPKTGQVELDLDVGVAIIRCHPDDIMRRAKAEKGESAEFQVGEVAVHEVKAFAESTFAEWERKGLEVIPSYVWQAAIEMIGAGQAVGKPWLPLVHTVGVKDADGKVLADRVYPAYYTEPPKSLGQITARAAKIVKAARLLDEEGVVPECEGPNYPCGYYLFGDAACGKAYEESQAKKKAKTEGLRNYDGPERKKLQTACLNWVRGDEQERKGKERKAKAKEQIAQLTGSTCRLGDYRVVHEAAEKGRVGWKDVAMDLGGGEKDDEYLDGFRGKPAVTVKVEMIDQEES